MNNDCLKLLQNEKTSIVNYDDSKTKVDAIHVLFGEYYCYSSILALGLLFIEGNSLNKASFEKQFTKTKHILKHKSLENYFNNDSIDFGDDEYFFKYIDIDSVFSKDLKAFLKHFKYSNKILIDGEDLD